MNSDGGDPDQGQQEDDNGDDSCYVLVRNIPKSFRSSHLRKFFADFVERERVRCFHFRHRPEVKRRLGGDAGEGSSASDTRCCLARFGRADAARFAAGYHGKRWTDERGEELQSKCLVAAVRVAKDGEGGQDVLSESDLSSMAELRPPAVMPRGNVGTPTQFFLDAIRQCRLPASVVGKLRLEFPRARRKRRYGAVEYGYEEEEELRRRRRKRKGARVEETGPESDDEGDEPPKEKGKFLDRSEVDARNASGPGEEKVKDEGESGSSDDDDTCEEWERHEALHDDVQARRAGNLGDDVSQQPGTKERLFEEEMEVTWDKGSSGLVFYTDAQVWREAEGDFDERTADDWDVDMSVYYDDEDGAGDLDAREGLDARRAIFRREGKVEESAFKKKADGQSRRERKTVVVGAGPSKDGKIGSFERHTRGFGRRIMEGQGWSDGRGLGPAARRGMAEALEGEGQVGKAGLGYHGRAIARPGFAAPKPVGRERRSARDILISTAFDDGERTDPAETLKRTNPQMYLKHRKK